MRFVQSPSSGELLLDLMFFFLVRMNVVLDFFSWHLLFMCVCFDRYFLRKLKKVKKSNGQVLAINEV